MDAQTHWDVVYGTKAPDEVSWFRPHLESSLALIGRLTPNLSAAILEVGGGASTLVDDLLSLGYRNLTVLDISQAALAITKKRLGPAALSVNWLAADITQATLVPDSCDLWHDRAVFHFLTHAGHRAKFVQNAASAVKPGGHLLLSTFGPDGPSMCSGLEVVRYDAKALQREFAPAFRLMEGHTEWHITPSGTRQQFTCCALEKH
jgi:SAM-dependent methyltransferase